MKLYIYISEVKRMAVSSEVNLDAKGLPVELLRDRGEGMLKLRIDRCITTSLFVCFVIPKLT